MTEMLAVGLGQQKLFLVLEFSQHFGTYQADDSLLISLVSCIAGQSRI